MISRVIFVFTWYKIGWLTCCGLKHLQFSYFLSIEITIGLSIFYIHFYIDLFVEFPFTHFSFLITILLGFPLSNTTNWLVAPTIGEIIIRIILLFYLVSCFLVLRCVKALACYKFIIWYKGGVKNGLIKLDSYNI